MQLRVFSIKFISIVLSLFVWAWCAEGFAQTKEVELNSAPTPKAQAQTQTSEATEAKTQVSKKTYDELTEEEKRIYDRGEIGQTAYILGGILGTYPLGFGIGHAIQGRFKDMGWIFLTGELVAGTLAMVGVAECISNSGFWSRNSNCPSSAQTKMTIGAFAFLGFRIWEIIDLWAGPPEHNRKYQQIRSRVQGSYSKPQIYLSHSFNTPTLGLSLHF